MKAGDNDATVKFSRGKKPPQTAAERHGETPLDPDLKRFADTVVIPALLSILARHTSERQKKLDSSLEGAA
jgi:hypothetical protein